MKTITVLDKEYSITEQKNDRNKVEFKEDQLLINFKDRSASSLLKEFLSDLLFNKVSEISEAIKKEGKIDLLGNLDFEIVEKIDKKKTRIAKLKGNKIILKQDLVALPENVIKYVIAHEIAHVSNKGHTKRFWKTVELICPNYKDAKKQLQILNNQLDI
jgi:predicted metal-dependent hydrolase